MGRLATGGMAEILLAKLLGPGGFQRAVVLKRVLPHLARKREFRTMFLDEARIVSAMRHPNVVQVQELGQDGQELFLVMEYLEGESVSGTMKRMQALHGRLSYSVSAYVVAEACAGLHAAHELTDEDGRPQNLIHRDVSPQNVFLTYDGGVKVLDFGIAKAADRYTHTQTGQMKGKFSYMAPEQITRGTMDRRVDIFAMGIVLYEISTGRRLFARDNELQVVRAICDEPIVTPSAVDPSYPKPLEAVVLKALTRDPDQRYGTAAEMRRDLLMALREIDPQGHPAEELASHMHTIFADRIGLKREMLRKVKSGDMVLAVPAEADASSLNDEDLASHPGSPGTLAMQELPAGEKTATKSRLPKLMLAAAALLIAGSGLALAFGGGGDDDDARGVRAAASAPPSLPAPAPGPTPAEPAAPARAPEAESTAGPAPEPDAPREVRIHVQTTPPGADVEVAGRTRGQTPLVLALPYGEGPVEIRVMRDGYEPLAERVVPDVDQRLRLALRPVRRVRVVRVRGGGTAQATAQPAQQQAAQPQQPAEPPQQPQRPRGFYTFE